MRACLAALMRVLCVAGPGLLVLTAGAMAQDKTAGASPTDMSDRINGQPLPMKPSKSVSEVGVLSADLKDAKGTPTGMRLFSYRTVRASETRSPIHAHPYGGQTCILSGEMTLYLEGAPAPQRAGPGTCYWMPPGARMSGANTGTAEAVMIDTFMAPSEKEIWVVMEAGMEDGQDQFSGAHKH